MKDIISAKKLLKMQIYREKDNDLLYINWQSYVNKMLKKFSTFDCRSIPIPFENHLKLSYAFCPKIKMNVKCTLCKCY